ncbi:hypothetical protein Ancab_015447 [Ancistrocladus abbreviatus]
MSETINPRPRHTDRYAYNLTRRASLPHGDSRPLLRVREVAHQEEMVGVFHGISTSSTNAGIGILKNSPSGKISSAWNAIEMCFPEKSYHFERNGSGPYEFREGLIDFIKRGREMSVSGFGQI